MTILVAIDYSDTGNQAFERAYALAKAEHSDLHVVNVVAPYGPGLQVELPQDAIAATIDEAGAELQKWVEGRLAAHASEGGGPRAVAHLRIGSAADEIAQLASDLEATLVVVGTHGRRGVRRLLLGSVAEAVVRLAPCPVMVFRPATAAADAPRIEPPCPRCVEARRESKGAEMWCEQHRERHGRRHTYSFGGGGARAVGGLPQVTGGT